MGEENRTPDSADEVEYPAATDDPSIRREIVGALPEPEFPATGTARISGLLRRARQRRNQRRS